MTAESSIDRKKLLRIIQPEGPLCQHLKGFEPRESQQKMMGDVIDAYNNQSISLIEAGTGTGKSMAYLIPAMIWAAENKERTVISTNTITLQEQLINKDIPLLTRLLKVEVKAVLVKGMGNYICLRKLTEAREETRLFPSEESAEIEKIDIAIQTASHTDGSRSNLAFVPSAATWDRVCAESDTCNTTSCPFYQECHFFKARRLANDAQLLIVNHHLLFADLALRDEMSQENDSTKNQGILPNYTRLILDEAHHIEDVATEYFAAKFTYLGILRILGKLAAEKQSKSQGKLPLLKEKLSEYYKKEKMVPSELRSLFDRLTIDLPGLRKDLTLQMTETFEVFVEFTQNFQQYSNGEEKNGQEHNKLRLLPMHYTHPYWMNHVLPRTQQLLGSLERYIQTLNTLEYDLKELKNERLNEQLKGIRYDIAAYSLRLAQASLMLKEFVEGNVPPTKVSWIEVQPMQAITNIHLVHAELDIAKSLANIMFSKFATIILCSATMTTNKQFQFVRQRLGLTSQLLKDRVVTESIYDSPFNYKQQALFAIPTDMPNPLHPQFIQEAVEKIWHVIQACHGNAFILFTSYSMLMICYQQLIKRLEDNRFSVFKQGDDNRHALLKKFQAKDRSILFGTDSFWEGVDVVGEALRCVIIVKLPFKVPSEPIIQARTEAILARGGDPFMEYSLPNAIVKFKQGFGRLIRNKFDRGCVVCLDSRIIEKKYGQFFLNSLPNCPQVFAGSLDLKEQLVEFYRRTYHLVKSKDKGK